MESHFSWILLFLAIFLDFSNLEWKCEISTFKLLSYTKLWCDAGTSSSIIPNGLYLNIGITFFMNLGIFGNIFGFFQFWQKKSNFHIQTMFISKVVVGCCPLLFYHLKCTISKHWNHIFQESRYFWQYFWIFPIFGEKIKFSHSNYFHIQNCGAMLAPPLLSSQMDYI